MMLVAPAGPQLDVVEMTPNTLHKLGITQRHGCCETSGVAVIDHLVDGLHQLLAGADGEMT